MMLRYSVPRDLAFKAFQVKLALQNMQVNAPSSMGKIQGGTFTKSTFTTGLANPIPTCELLNAPVAFDGRTNIAAVQVKGIKGVNK